MERHFAAWASDSCEVLAMQGAMRALHVLQVGPSELKLRKPVLGSSMHVG